MKSPETTRGIIDWYNMPSLAHSFSEYDSAINRALATYFEDSIERAHAIHPRYELLWGELSRVTQADGKRLRPRATILAYQAFGGKDISAIIPVAVAQEVLHASLLIHDDIIDRELTRRGELNISGIYLHDHYKDSHRPHQSRHHSDSTALLGGNLLLTMAFQLIHECPLAHERVVVAQNILHRIVFEVAAGQLLDNEVVFLNEIDAPAELIARYKTASYSFIGPLLIGAALAGAEAASFGLLEKYATNLGIAYQLSDDLLGLFGKEAVTGKSTISDLREGKRTYLVEQFIALSDKQDSALFFRTFGDPKMSPKEADELKRLMQKSGAVEKTQVQLQNHVSLARSALDQLKLTQDSHNKFENLIMLSTQRLS